MWFFETWESFDVGDANLDNELLVLLVLFPVHALNKAGDVPEYSLLFLLIVLHFHTVDKDSNQVRHFVANLPVIVSETCLHP